MSQEQFSDRCQNCGGSLKAERFSCPDCGLRLEGTIELPRLARLSAEEREFVELFVLSAGSLKEVGRHLGLSYPTVRARLDRVIESLLALDRDRKRDRLAIMERLENRQIDAEEAARLLAQL